MTGVVSRKFASTPQRHADHTWEAIVSLLTQGKAGNRRNELLAVTGVAASIIADQAPKDAAIVVTCDGTRTRVYCLYDEDAIEGSDANEDSLNFDPLKGNWAISLPCEDSDLEWVRAALKKHSTRITARDKSEKIAADSTGASSQSGELVLNVEGFLAQ